MAFAQPGKSYEEMWQLIHNNLPQNCPFSLELIMAICWEESLFNNMEQIGGTAWGFGQVEPAEYYKFRTPDAAFPVPSLPPVRTYKVEVKDKDGKVIEIKKARLSGVLTDQQSVQVVISCLVHGYRALGSKQASLRAYAGVGYAGSDVPSRLSDAGKRLAIIEGWLACEAYLQRKFVAPPPSANKNVVSVPGIPDDYPSFIKMGLAKAKEFDTKSQVVDDILFPKNYVTEDKRRIWWPNPHIGAPYQAISASAR
jgi:hypothetical protein